MFCPRVWNAVKIIPSIRAAAITSAIVGVHSARVLIEVIPSPVAFAAALPTTWVACISDRTVAIIEIVITTTANTRTTEGISPRDISPFFPSPFLKCLIKSVNDFIVLLRARRAQGYNVFFSL
jgi:hypothetical protein